MAPLPKYHLMEAEEVVRELKSDVQAGLSAEEAKLRLERYGYNELKKEKGLSPLTIFINQFRNTLIINPSNSHCFFGFNRGGGGCGYNWGNCLFLCSPRFHSGVPGRKSFRGFEKNAFSHNNCFKRGLGN